MSCGCPETICVEVNVNPCTTGTVLDIEATETGIWTGVLEFNNTWKHFGIAVTDGQDISILTALLNENYVHDLVLYDTSGNKTCYRLKTRYTSFVPDAPVPEGHADIWEWKELNMSGNTLVSPYLTGEVAPIIWMDSNPTRWGAQGITHDDETGTLDFTTVGGFEGVITFQYKNLAT